MVVEELARCNVFGEDWTSAEGKRGKRRIRADQEEDIWKGRVRRQKKEEGEGHRDGKGEKLSSP